MLAMFLSLIFILNTLVIQKTYNSLFPSLSLSFFHYFKFSYNYETKLILMHIFNHLATMKIGEKLLYTSAKNFPHTRLLSYKDYNWRHYWLFLDDDNNLSFCWDDNEMLKSFSFMKMDEEGHTRGWVLVKVEETDLHNE